MDFSTNPYKLRCIPNNPQQKVITKKTHTHPPARLKTAPIRSFSLGPRNLGFYVLELPVDLRKKIEVVGSMTKIFCKVWKITQNSSIPTGMIRCCGRLCGFDNCGFWMLAMKVRLKRLLAVPFSSLFRIFQSFRTQSIWESCKGHEGTRRL